MAGSARAAAALLLLAATGAVAAPPIDGAEIYAQNCAACHQPAGQGIAGAFPALVGNKFVLGNPAAPVGVVLNGRAGMPAFRDSLDDEQLAALLSHIRASWGNTATPVPATLVAKLRGGAMAAAKPAPIPGH